MAKRSERLLQLLQGLRRRRRPVTGDVLATELGVSKRSLYRDIAALRGMGLAVDGEPGIGFALREDTFLPPLSFSQTELEALVLGLRGLLYGPDHELAGTARDTMSKLIAVLSPAARAEMESIGLFALPRGGPEGDTRLPVLRRALREELQLRLDYTDLNGSPSSRVVYPVALGYDGNRQILIAWCTLRNDYRSFRVAGMGALDVLSQRLPEPRRNLFHRWRAGQGFPDLA